MNGLESDVLEPWPGFEGAEQYHALCRSIGGRYARKFDTIEAEDIEQECATELIASWWAWKAADVVEEAFPSYVKSALERAAATYCRKELAELYQFSAQYTYRPEDVRRALPNFIAGLDAMKRRTRPDHDPVLYPVTSGHEDEWQNSVPLPDDYADGEGSDDLAFMGDISRVWRDLPGHHQATLRLYVSADPGGMTGVQRMAATRAVDLLTGLLNGNRRKDGPGTRHASPNHTAQARTGFGWEDAE